MSQTGQTPLLQVEDLVVRYGKKLAPAVDGVSFTIARGETLGLIGESGSGKTTIGRAILGLAPVASGRILFDGRDITRASAAERRALRGDLRAVFQDPYSSLDPRMPIGTTIAEPLRVARRPEPERNARVRDVLESVCRPAPANATRASSPAASASASRSLARS
ncbi:MAG: ATP-binding cassette domain-containing protein [Microbacterium sp.]